MRITTITNVLNKTSTICPQVLQITVGDPVLQTMNVRCINEQRGITPGCTQVLYDNFELYKFQRVWTRGQLIQCIF
jgi:hypothetical protein